MAAARSAGSSSTCTSTTRRRPRRRPPPPSRSATTRSRRPAWSRLIEVQGFGQRFVRRGRRDGRDRDDPRQRADAVHHLVPKTALGGTPGSGSGFTVVLNGQDGFSPDQARGFQPTPQDFQFGVCAAASADPHCTFDPGRVPKAIDVLTPAGTQSGELDYTVHDPVTIAPVIVP